MRDVVALWYVDKCTCAEIVYAAWVHGRFGHTRLELAESHSALDDDYDIGHIAVDEIDAEVLAEARRIAEPPPDSSA